MPHACRSIKRYCIAIVLCFFIAAATVYCRPLAVTFFDVEEADAALICTPGGKTILIDGGSAPYTVDDQAVRSREVLPLLKRNGITRLDAVVVSHSHGDHAAGLVNVLAALPVGKVYDSGYGTRGDLDYHRCMDLVREKSIPYGKIGDGAVLDWGDGVTMEVFCPPPGKFKETNDNSLIIKMTYGNSSFLFAGDAQRDEEDWAVRKHGGRLEADILKVGHHGSGTSSGALFLNTVRPRFAVISCGLDNPFGHPHAQTLFAFRKRGIRVYRTDYDGDVRVTVDGGRVNVATEKKSSYIKSR